jgi:hypothetical protein
MTPITSNIRVDIFSTSLNTSNLSLLQPRRHDQGHAFKQTNHLVHAPQILLTLSRIINCGAIL